MRPEFAFYYPGQYWHDLDWIKNLVCFFDGIAMLVPDYMPDVKSFDDYPLAASLKERDMLRIIRPEQVVDSKATQKLHAALSKILDSGALEALVADGETNFGSLSMSRLGFYGNRKMAEDILDMLKKRGWATNSKDGASIPMHSVVRALILVLLAQILRAVGDDMEITLSPATDQRTLVDALMEVIASDCASAPTNADIVAFDMATVGVDLSTMPLDELLDYRKQYRHQHRDYILAMRKFARELSEMPHDEKTAAFEQRQRQLDDLAQQLRNDSRRSWKKQASLALALVGATWTAATSDPIAAALAGATAIYGFSRDRSETGVYSYLFSTPGTRRYML